MNSVYLFTNKQGRMCFFFIN